jgi:hypothetical protein
MPAMRLAKLASEEANRLTNRAEAGPGSFSRSAGNTICHLTMRLSAAALAAGLACPSINARADQVSPNTVTIEFKNYPLTLKTIGPDIHVTASGQLTCYPDSDNSWDAKGEGIVLETIYAGSHASCTASARHTPKGRQVLMEFKSQDLLVSIAMQAINKEASAPSLDKQARDRCRDALSRSQLRN